MSDFNNMKLHGGLYEPQILDYDTMTTRLSQGIGGELLRRW